MPFNPNMVYRLTNPSRNFLEAPQIVLGLEQTRGKMPAFGAGMAGVETALYGYIGADEQGHSTYGEILAEYPDGTIDLRDLWRISDDDKPVIWRFEPLTLARWREMADGVQGYAELAGQIATDNDLQHFYRMQFS